MVRLVDLGILSPEDEDRFSSGDVRRVLMAKSLEDAGIALEDVASAIKHHAIIRRTLGRHHGVEIDTAGDCFYATFDGPARAIRCALEMSERVRELGVEIRIGVHTGECEIIDNKLGGISVTTGARIAGLADPSEILVSQR